ncbi:Hpt domain-containing protein [Pseudoalteromonas sp. JBTF-M23]|uniref:Hpt domain-containing protein n=1 Tax=Pseudoalteromonas caenipelagi TaxID=2726988 RepID=A0A849V853_9GAMM|nr:Hpt domain-containing protein [Pseudoalteromonas caenipelagi]NOU48950.1 Hpt domain-containing protein [Pseudoalteromonas caenipelagi]
MSVSIDNEALESMQSLLGEQFEDTLIFCCSEFERLENDLKLALDSDKQEAIRHAHSLKSNAAQFGAISLSSTARAIELGLIKGDEETVTENMEIITEQVVGSKSQLLQWLSMNS